MVIMRVRAIDLDNLVDTKLEGQVQVKSDLIAMDWEVSDTMNFSNVVLRSVQNKTNLRSIVFNKNLDPNKKWYGRARALLSTGYTEWGNLDVFVVDNTVLLTDNQDLPSNISIPLIKTRNSVGNLLADTHDTTLFDIVVSGFSVVGNAKLKSVSYWIEDIYSNVVWSSPYDEVHVEYINVSDVILKQNSVYRIKAMFHSTSGDSSQIATYTIRTNGGGHIDLITFMDNIEANMDTVLEFNTDTKFTIATWEIIAYDDSSAQPIWTSRTNKLNFVTVPANTLNAKTSYLLRIGLDTDDPSFRTVRFKTI